MAGLWCAPSARLNCAQTLLTVAGRPPGSDLRIRVREGVIAPFLASVPDNGFKTVCQMKWIIINTLPQSESIIHTTSELYSASLYWKLNTKVDIKGEKGKP